MPFFSIIVPVYNVEKYFKQCIESILMQSFTDYEVILVDDGSTDNSSAMCDEYGENCDKVSVIHQKNKGLGGARNTGIKNAKGKWILFVDSDDSLPDNALSKWKDEICATSDVSVFVARYLFQDEAGKEFKDDSVFKSEFIAGKCCTGDLKKAVTRYSDTVGWAVWKLAIERDFIINNDILFYEPIRYAEDLYWVFKLFMQAKEICFVNIYVYVYRVNRCNGLSTNTLRMLEGNLQTIQKLEQDFAGEKLSDNQKFALAFLCNAYFYQVFRCTNLPKDQQAKRREMINQNKYILKYIDKDISSKKQRMLVLLLNVMGIKAVDGAIKIMRG